MKRIFLVLLSVLLFQGNSNASNEVSSKIEGIVIYKDSAYVKRSAHVIVKKGENSLKFSATSNLVDNSISVEIKKGDGKILDVKVEKTYLYKQYQEKAKAIKERIDTLEKEMNQLSGEATAINNYIEFLKKLSPFTTSTKLLQSEFEGYARFIESSIMNGYRRIADIEIRLSKYKEEKTNLEKELANIGSQKEETKNIILTIYAYKDGEIDLEIGYLAGNAAWNPQYDIHVDTAKNTIIFDVYASIIQNTGEDWKNVRLEISTSRPVSGKLGELSPWYVDIYEPGKPVFFKSMAAPEARVSEKTAKDIREPDEKEEIQPELKEGLTSFNFILKDPVSIPSDNQPHRVFLASEIINKVSNGNSLLNYHTIPKLSPYVYLTGYFENPFDFPLFTGKMNIYLDGKFVRVEELNKTFEPNEDIQISLGIDDSIKVERKRVKKFTEYAGIVSKTKKLTYEYETTITSGKSRSVNLTVIDNYPVSLNEQIKVWLESPAEKEAEILSNGKIIWKINLEPKTSKKLLLKFKLEYPKDLRITGVE